MSRYVLFAVMGVVSQFEAYLEQDVIEDVTVGGITIKGTFKSAQNGKTGFVTTPVAPDLADRLSETDVTYSGAIENTWFTTLLSWVLPALIFVGIGMVAPRHILSAVTVRQPLRLWTQLYELTHGLRPAAPGTVEPAINEQ